MIRIIIALFLLTPLAGISQDDLISRLVSRIEPLASEKIVTLAFSVTIIEEASPRDAEYLKRIVGNRLSRSSKFRIKDFPFRDGSKRLITEGAENYREALQQQNIDYFLNIFLTRHRDNHFITCQILAREKGGDDLFALKTGYSSELALLFREQPPDKIESGGEAYRLLARFPVTRKALAISGFGNSGSNSENLALLTTEEIMFFSFRNGSARLIKRTPVPSLERADYATRAPVATLQRINEPDNMSQLLASSNLWSQSFLLEQNDFITEILPFSVIAPFSTSEELMWLTGSYLPGENTFSSSVRITNSRGATYKLFAFENLKSLHKISSGENHYLARTSFNKLSLWLLDSRGEIISDADSITNRGINNGSLQHLHSIKALAFDDSSGGAIVTASSGGNRLPLAKPQGFDGDYLVFLDRSDEILSPYKVLIPTALDIKDLAVYNPGMSFGKAVAVLGVTKNKDLIVEIYSWPESLSEGSRGNGN